GEQPSEDRLQNLTPHSGVFDEPLFHDNCIFSVAIVSFCQPGFREPPLRIEMDSAKVALAYFEPQWPFVGKPFFELHKQCLPQALPSTIRAYRDRDQVIMVLPSIDNPIAYDLVVEGEHEKGFRIVSREFRQKVRWIRIVEACLLEH